MQCHMAAKIEVQMIAQFWNYVKSSNRLEDMIVQRFSHKICSYTRLIVASKTFAIFYRLFYGFIHIYNKTSNCKNNPHKNLTKGKLYPNMLFSIISGFNKPCKTQFLFCILSLFLRAAPRDFPQSCTASPWKPRPSLLFFLD